MIEPFTGEYGMHIVSDVVALINTVYKHALGNRDHLGNDLVQYAYDGTFVAMIGYRISDKRE
jgi:hypothetical protein